MKKIIVLGLVLVSLLGSFMSVAAEIKVGVQSPRGALKAMKRWGELSKYLEAELGVPVKIIPLQPGEFMTSISTGQISYALSNPVVAVSLQHKFGATPIATMNKKSGNQFAGVIISKKGSGITKGTDLKGKKVMGFKFKRSAAAYVFQVKHLMDQGIDPHKDFSIFKEAKKQDDIILAVKAGIFDAGFVKSGLIESMKKDGISVDDFEIIDKKSDSLSSVHSTELYPEWTLSANKDVPTGDVEKFKAAMLKLTASSEVSKKAKIVGFVEALPLDSLAETLKTLKLPPFNN